MQFHKNFTLNHTNMLMIFEIILSCTLYISAIMCKKIPLPKQAKAIAILIYTKNY